MATRITQEEFIIRAKDVHGDKYDYSKSIYKDSETKIEIICPLHGSFYQIPYSHWHGGCRKCAWENNAKNRLRDPQYLIEQAKKKHNNFYDYSLVEYENSKKTVKIICPNHGVFEQFLKTHATGVRCFFCYLKIPKCCDQVDTNETQKLDSSEKKKIRTDFLIEKCREVHGDLYDYDFSDFISIHKKIPMTCKVHGLFYQTPSNHITNKQECPKCHKSHGEKSVAQYLDLYHIKYVIEKSFDNIVNPKTGRKLKFDFYLPEYNLCIEYDGSTHYIPWPSKDRERSQKILLNVQERDREKTKQCLRDNIPLLRIPYTSFNDLNVILTDALNLYTI